MKIEVKKLDKGQIELTIEITVDEYRPFLEQAAKKISADTKIPGFRPGKANFELIKQKVGENEIWQKALEPAVQKTFLRALGQEKLITVGSPQIDVVKLAPNNPMIYKATVSLLPNVELGDYSKMKVNKKPVEVKDEQFEKAMSNVQKMHAKQTLVDRQAQKGDKVEIDFETFLDKVPIDQGKQEKFPIVIGEDTFIPGFEDQLIGLSKDETKEFQLEFPKNYHQKNMAGRLADFKVKMNAVYRMELPELNDDFAQSLGNFKTIREIEDEIKDNLKTETERKENQRLEEEIIDKIIDQSKFDEIPDLLIDSETKKMVQELEQNLVSQGLKFEDYLNHLKKKREDLFLDFVPQAIKRIKSALTIRKIREKENIKADDKEIEAEIEKIKTIYAGNPEIEKNLNQPAYRDYLRNILAARKVIEHLKSVMVE
jgi:trigger factor